LIDYTKWKTIGVQTKISARNLVVEKIFNKLCETKEEGVKIWGEYPLINNFLGLKYTDKEKPQSFLYIFKNSTNEIQQSAGIWLNYFKNIGIQFIDKIITDKNFSLQLVLKGKGVMVYDRYRCLPIMCKQYGMSNEEIEVICIELEKEIDEINETSSRSDEFKARWVNEYYIVKNAVINGKMPSRSDVVRNQRTV